MNKTRLEAFSDGVLAIIITIMVLELKVPHDASWASLLRLLPVLLSYIISFTLIGIYWGNHHNLLHGAKTVNAKIILANLHLLFWLSLIPSATSWMGENHFAVNTIILYALMLMFCGLAYSILQNYILKYTALPKELRIAIKKQNRKVIVSVILDLLAIPFAFVNPYISGFLFFLQSAIWLIPDRNIEDALNSTK
jgi:uncharacterized membrane protein